VVDGVADHPLHPLALQDFGDGVGVFMGSLPAGTCWRRLVGFAAVAPAGRVGCGPAACRPAFPVRNSGCHPGIARQRDIRDPGAARRAHNVLPWVPALALRARPG
jgi:hypothetical protein